ncbi:MAG: metal-sensitive transcriptional regulator [Betaproteobacteria bacterium]|nr:metal-sensitive transcriptional regulator [Betaproteobacteria bacterium]
MMSKTESPTPCHDGEKTVTQPHKKALLNRLNRIAGQVKGISNMIESDRYCIDILTQISAIQSALNAVVMQLIEDHTKGCVRKAIWEGDGDVAISELMGVLKKINR